MILLKKYKSLIIIISCLILIIFCSILFRSTFLIGRQSNNKGYILAITSNDPTAVNQQRKIVVLDIRNNKIIKELYSYNVGHDLEAAISPDKSKLAINKWVDNMDLDLFVVDLKTHKETQVTDKINGEISRISWINNDEILYTYVSHNAKIDGLGMRIYILNIKNGTRKMIDGLCLKDNKPIYWFNTVRYIPQLQKIVMVRGLADDFFEPMVDGTVKAPKNQLYLCNIDGTNEKMLVEIKDRTIGRVVATPDGKKLVIEAYYIQGDKEPSDLYIYDLEKNKLELLLKSGQGYEEHWNIFALDNENILFRCNNKLYKMNLKTKVINKMNISNVPPGTSFIGFDYF